MAKQSAGILLYRWLNGELQFLLVHPGGPFWAKKDEGAWTIPKGEIGINENPMDAAKREFEEELGSKLQGKLIQLTSIKQKGGKIVHAWAVEGDFDIHTLTSNVFEMEWPPHSGQKKQFPEVDRAAWFNKQQAEIKMIASQIPFLEEVGNRMNK